MFDIVSHDIYVPSVTYVCFVDAVPHFGLCLDVESFHALAKREFVGQVEKRESFK